MQVLIYDGAALLFFIYYSFFTNFGSFDKTWTKYQSLFPFCAQGYQEILIARPQGFHLL